MSLDNPDAIETGRLLVAGRYELGPVIGIGASAVVYRACDVRSGDLVAVKLFRPGASAHDRRQQRQEMAALARLAHPGLVALHDGGIEDGRPFVVTDLVEGPTLAERILTDGPMDPAQIRGLGAHLAGALAHVHAGGFVHRDVKPANVLLGDGTRPRLADFGIARALDGTAATATGLVVGTAAFLAPEQVRGERVGPAADVYALGLVLLETLKGSREYPGLAVESAMARLHRPPVVPEGLPGGLGAVLEAMTAAEAGSRPTAATVAAELARQAGAGDATKTLPVPAAPREGRTPRARVALVLTAAALVLFTGTGGMGLFTGTVLPASPPATAELDEGGARPVVPAPAAPVPTVAPGATAAERVPGAATGASSAPRPAGAPVVPDRATAGERRGDDDRDVRRDAKDRAEPGKTGPGKADPGKADPGKADPGKAGPRKAGPRKAGPRKAGPRKAGTAKADTGKGGGGKAGRST